MDALYRLGEAGAAEVGTWSRAASSGSPPARVPGSSGDACDAFLPVALPVRGALGLHQFEHLAVVRGRGTESRGPVSPSSQ